jgi:hypothetical protein
MKKKPMTYLQPDSTQTLREGVMELRAAETADSDAAESFAPELKHDIDVHDAIHVLFACPTTLAGEIVAHVWTAFGTTASMADMHRVNAHRDHRAVLAQIGHWRLVRTWFRSLPRIFITLRSARRMVRRWPVEEMSSFFDRRLCDIRQEFGIRLPSVPPSAPGDSREGGAALRSIRHKIPSLATPSA